MIFNLFDMLFGCWHKNCSFPITARGDRRRSAAARVTGTYVVCLDCGKEFPYDWKEMKIIANSPEPLVQPICGDPAESWHKVA